MKEPHDGAPVSIHRLYPGGPKKRDRLTCAVVVGRIAVEEEGASESETWTYWGS